MQRGVTHTLVTRGATDASLGWVVEVNMPSLATSPDRSGPARSVQDKAAAEDTRAKLAEAGFAATISAVEQPAVADLPASTLGHRLRLDQTSATKAEADALVSELKAKGFSSRSWFTGWDGGTDAKGPWRINVLTIDPKTFTGTLGATYGPDLATREKTTELAAFTRASATINAGFFVMDPKAGAEGDPAGAGIYDGKLVSETITGRPALVLDPKARHTRIVTPVWKGVAILDKQRFELDGVNRVIGLIRDCGGDLTDKVTHLPLHDVTCTDDAETIAYTPDFAATTPAGEGAEVVLEGTRVVAVKTERGTALEAGQTSIQATGEHAARLLDVVQTGERGAWSQGMTDGRARLDKPRTTVVNGGPELVRHGDLHVTQKRDGMNQPLNPSFDYGWVLQRNPRTFAGIDAKGRTLLVTVDGRQLTDLGLSIPETAQVAKDLGMVDAINLDGGGSTAMVLDGALVTSPSDAAGERPVGDAIFIR
ncbi:phosphodiester glycosidase family protein [Luteococcus sp. Sow4_B9]|uniref:phosphodiester glycosidase family protein n=1 Tax=Luteococcus sp. Sow4_B9 TaxID=3438792 RepID=UPI003F985746